MINNQNIPFNNKDKLLKILFWSVTFYTFFSTLSTSFFPATLIDVIYKVSLISSVLLIVISIYKYKNTKKNKNYYVLYLFFFLYYLCLQLDQLSQ